MIFISGKELRAKVAQYVGEFLWDIEIKQTTESLASEYLVFFSERVN